MKKFIVQCYRSLIKSHLNLDMNLQLPDDPEKACQELDDEIKRYRIFFAINPEMANTT
jgi:hypothetical protein